MQNNYADTKVSGEAMAGETLSLQLNCFIKFWTHIAYPFFLRYFHPLCDVNPAMV